MNLSKNGIGILLLILSTVGVTVAEADLVTTVSTIGQLVSGLLMIWNQVTRSDVSAFLFKK